MAVSYELCDLCRSTNNHYCCFMVTGQMDDHADVRAKPGIFPAAVYLVPIYMKFIKRKLMKYATLCTFHGAVTATIYKSVYPQH